MTADRGLATTMFSMRFGTVTLVNLVRGLAYCLRWKALLRHTETQLCDNDFTLD